MNDRYMVVCSDCFSGGEEYTIGFLTPRKCEKCGNISDSLHAEPRRRTVGPLFINGQEYSGSNTIISNQKGVTDA